MAAIHLDSHPDSVTHGSRMTEKSGLSGRKNGHTTGAQVLGPSNNLGAGDSRIIHNVLSAPLIDNAFHLLKDQEVDWQTMSHQGGSVPRLVAVQGEIGNDGSIPLYRHPADESPSLRPFSPTIQKIREQIEDLLKQPFNHALIQLYRDGNDNISEHSDKTLDIVRGSNIVNVSLGAQRAMTLRAKKSKGAGNGTDTESGIPRQVQRTPMPHNSVFVLGPRTNLEWLRGVRADKRMSQLKSYEEKSFGGERISITFRQIGTFMHLDLKTLWGSGAKQKSKDTAGEIVDDEVEMVNMVKAFSKENHQPDFEWEQHYGQGFDVINLRASSAVRLP